MRRNVTWRVVSGVILLTGLEYPGAQARIPSGQLPEPSLRQLWIAREESSRVRWRDDYAEARKEAEERRLPLLLFCGHSGCVFTAKQERELRSSPELARLVNRRFVPLLLLDEPEQERLFKHLNVTLYPTLILADSSGKILGRIGGFRDFRLLREDLRRALERIGPDGKAKPDR